MDSGIRSARGGYSYGFSEDLCQRSLQFERHRANVRLQLKTRELCAVVFNDGADC